MESKRKPKELVMIREIENHSIYLGELGERYIRAHVQ